MAKPARVPDAWTRARDRFTQDLSEEEKYIYYQATPETILYAVSASEKRLGEQSKTRWGLDKLKPFIENVEHYGKAMDVFANTYPLVMSPLWGGFRIVLILAQEAGQYFDKIAQMLLKLGETLPRIQIFEDLFSQHERVVQALSAIYCDLLTFCYEAKKILRKPKRSMFSTAWKTFERQFNIMLSDFERHQNAVEKEVNASHMIESAESRIQSRRDQLARVREHREQEIWHAFASLSDIDYEAQLAKLCDLRREGTCAWLANDPEFSRWRMTKHSSGLCVRGIPGSGKSVLMAKFVSDILSQPNNSRETILFHFCDYAEATTLKPQSIYRSFLKQAYLQGNMPKTVVDEIVSQSRRSSFGPHEHASLELLTMTIRNIGRVSIICDGIDECEEVVQRTMCRSLNRFLDLHFAEANIKILVTCREEERPLMYLSQFSHMTLTEDVVRGDIRHFVIHEVEAILAEGEMKLCDPSLKQEIIDKLLEKADGMFLWVDLQIKSLCETISDTSIRYALEHLPRGLKETYKRMAEKALTSHSPQQVSRALRWVACAQRALSLRELQEAVYFSPADKSWNNKDLPDMDKLLQQCHGLLVRALDSTVRFAHHTALQFCVSGGPQHTDCDSARTVFSIIEAHDWVARVCVTYLSFTDFESAIAVREEQRHIDINNVFARGGPVAIPTSLGLMPRRFESSKWFMRKVSKANLPTIDFAQYVKWSSFPNQSMPQENDQYALFSYAQNFWPFHSTQQTYYPDHAFHDFSDPTREFLLSMVPPNTSQDNADKLRWPLGLLAFYDQFWLRCLQGSSMSLYEFRPWGTNQHYGPWGCKGCPPSDAEYDSPKWLTTIAALHWAAKANHLPLMLALGGRLSGHLHHERYSQQTLISACGHGHVKIVQTLLAHGAKPADSEALRAACMGGHLDILRLLQSRTLQLLSTSWEREHNTISEIIAHNLGRCVVGPAGQNLAHLAAERGHVHILDDLRRKFGYKNNADLRMRTLYHYAIKCEQIEVVRWLLEHSGQDIGRYGALNQVSLDGEFPLGMAARLGNSEIVKLLLDYGCDWLTRGHSIFVRLPPRVLTEVFMLTDNVSLRCEPSAFDLASCEGHTHVLRLIHSVVFDKGFPMTDMLVNHNPDHGERYLTALELAAYNGKAETVAFLAQQQYFLPASTWKDILVLSLLLGIIADSASVIGVLLTQWPSAFHKSPYKLSPLHLAVIDSRLEALKALVRLLTPEQLDERANEIDVDGHDLRGMNALHIAALRGDGSAMEILLPAVTQEKIDETVQNSANRYSNQTALHLSMASVNLDAIRILLDWHAEPSIKCPHWELVDHRIDPELFQALTPFVWETPFSNDSTQSYELGKRIYGAIIEREKSTKALIDDELLYSTVKLYVSKDTHESFTLKSVEILFALGLRVNAYLVDELFVTRHKAFNFLATRDSQQNDDSVFDYLLSTLTYSLANCRMLDLEILRLSKQPGKKCWKTKARMQKIFEGWGSQHPETKYDLELLEKECRAGRASRDNE